MFSSIFQLLVLYDFILLYLARSVGLLHILLANSRFARIDLSLGDSDRLVPLIIQINFLNLVDPRRIAIMIILKFLNRNDMHLTVIFISVLVFAHILMRGILVTHSILHLVLVVLIWFLARHETDRYDYVHDDDHQQIQA